jgi:glycosyltransferase involved in cell wall biosynthesis
VRILIVVPAHNEAQSLPAVVAELRGRHPERQILVVDDGSTDETVAVLDRLAVDHVRLGSPLGLGGAMRTGFRYAHTHGYDVVVRMDGDGQHDSESIDTLLEPVLAGRADVVRGSRYLGDSAYQAVGFRRVAQHFVARLLSMMTGETVTDPTSGFWAYGPRAVALLVHHHPTGYPEPELLLLLHRNGMRTREVPVRMRERLAGRTTLNVGRTLLAIARVLLALLIVPLRPAVGDHP